MAAPAKKRGVEEMDVQSDDEDYSSSEDEDSAMDGEVQVDFEAMQPSDADSDGIRTLLSQLFLKANIDLGQLTDTLISQNYVGCVLKQCEVSEDEESDDEMDDDTVFGLVTIMNMSDRKNLECVKQIKQMVLTHCEKYAPDQLPFFQQLLEFDKQIGFLINERFINIPPAVAVPMFESLRKDLQSEKVSKMNYKFDSGLIVCKTCRPRPEGNNCPVDMKEVTFLNAEEEILLEHATQHFTYSVAAERDTIVDGKWVKEDMESMRTVVVLEVGKMNTVIDALKGFIDNM